jgi:superfamily II DNA or RNA helicase/intein/homing endonuclease
MLELRIGNLYTRVDKKKATKEELDSLHQLLSVKVAGAFFSPAYRRGMWDGLRRFFHRGTGVFYSGLLFYVKEHLPQFEFIEIDERIRPAVQNNPLNLNGIQLREYQTKMIYEATRVGRGIISAPPNSGKTEVACGIIQCLGLPAVFLTHRLALLDQTRERFEKRLGVEIGIMGRGEMDIKDINVFSVTSLVRKLEDPEISDVLQKSPVLIVDECFPGYSKVFIDTDFAVPIKDIYNSDSITHVLSYNCGIQAFEKKKIIRKIRNPRSSSHLFITVKLGDEYRKICCTPNHKIFCGGNYIEADKLKIGDKVKLVLTDFSVGRICSKCGKVVRKGSHAHWPLTHKPYSKITCRKCGRIFKTTSEFVSHHLNYHYMKTDAFQANIKKAARVRGDRMFGKNNPSKSPEMRKAQSIRQREWWAGMSKEERDWRLKTFMNAPVWASLKPTSLEKVIINFEIPKLDYTGMGDFWVTFSNGRHKNPDFVYKKDRKVIEVVDIEYWHKGENFDELRRLYKEIGYDCLVLATLDFKDPNLKGRIEKFLFNHEGEIIDIKKHPAGNTKFVYNLEIEDNHNYFVEGVLVSNCHHVSSSTFEKCVKASGAYYRFGLCVSGTTRISLGNGKERSIQELYKKFENRKFEVLSFNHTTNNIEIDKAQVVRIPKRERSLYVFVRDKLNNIRRLSCSPKHRIFVEGKNYIEAKSVSVGDKVHLVDLPKNYCAICGKEIPSDRVLCGKDCKVRNWIVEGAKGTSKRLQSMSKEERRKAINWKPGLEKCIQVVKTSEFKKRQAGRVRNFWSDPGRYDDQCRFRNIASKTAIENNKNGAGLKGCRNRWKKYPTKEDRVKHLLEIGCCGDKWVEKQFKKGHKLSQHPPLSGIYYNNKVCFSKDGHKVASMMEKKVDDWLSENGLVHKLHPRIENSGKFSDFLVNGWYIEVDGLQRGYSYFEKRYSGLTNWILIEDVSYSAIQEKLGFLLVSDPFGEVISVCKANSYCGRYLYDLQVEGNCNFFANRILVHNSATPLLRDDVSNMLVRGLLGSEISVVSNEELIRWGISAHPTVYLFEINTPTFPLHYPYYKTYDEGIVKNVVRNSFIVKTAKRFVNLKKSVFIIVFRIEHGQILTDMLKEAGVDVEFIRGEGSSPLRNSEILKLFSEKQIPCIVSSSISDEGIDVPALDCLVLAVGDRSALKLIQRVGRGLRKKKSGENRVQIIDCMDLSNPHLKRHSTARLETYYKLGFDLFEVLDSEWEKVIELN